MAEAVGQVTEVWGEDELEPAYLLDLGDRILALGYFHGRGRASGVQLEQEFVQLITLRKGLIARDGPTGPMRWDDGLRAAGLDPDAIALPSTRTTR